MLVCTLDAPAGWERARPLGLVRGSAIRTRHVGADLVAGLRNLFGGEIPEYTQLMAAAREQALARMIREAMTLGADAVLGVRFETAAVMQGAAEVVAYGTAVRRL